MSTKIVDYVLEICKDMKLETIHAIMLTDNYKAVSILEKMGFTLKYLDDGTVNRTLNLKKEEEIECQEPKISEASSKIQAETPLDREEKKRSANTET